MSAAVKSTLTVTYTPTNREEIEVCRYNATLLSAPEATWELQTQTCDLPGSPWAADRANGNVRRKLKIQTIINRPNVSALVRYMRHVELEANMNREGNALWAEGFVAGLPTYKARWQALVMECTARQLEQEEIPCDKQIGAWGLIEWDLLLTNPKEL